MVANSQSHEQNQKNNGIYVICQFLVTGDYG